VPSVHVGLKVKGVVSGGRVLSVFTSGYWLPDTVKMERMASSMFAMVASRWIADSERTWDL